MDPARIRRNLDSPAPATETAPMIIRYSRPEAVAIWSQETKYSIWFEI